MKSLDLTPEQHARIFGPQLEERRQGRSRLCRVCGGWHALDRPWPHNCRGEQRPPPKLAAPMLAPRFPEHVAHHSGEPEVIWGRRSQREYMKRNDLIQYEEGIEGQRKPEWIEEREEIEAFGQALKKQTELDPLARPPIERIGESDLAGAEDIDTTRMDVIE